MKIANIEEMRELERATDAGGFSYVDMMDTAGTSVGAVAERMILGDGEKNVLVLVGPGNNGGDGLVASRFLIEGGHQVTVYVWKRDVRGDENFRTLKRRRRGIAILWADNDPDWGKLREELRRTDLVVDALLGTGATRPVEGTLAKLLAVVEEEVSARWRASLQKPPAPYGMPRFPIVEAQSLGMDSLPGMDPEEWGAGYDPPFAADEDAYDDEDWPGEPPEEGAPSWPTPAVLAVDCPSGLNCDTGAVDLATVPAHITVTFGVPKWGQLQYPGAGACGLLAVADINLAAAEVDRLSTELVVPDMIQQWLPDRPANAHKGTFGKVLIVAGSVSYTGAAYLSASAAGHAGAGLVTVAVPAPLHAALAGVLPEVTWLPLTAPDGTHCPAGLEQLMARIPEYGTLLIGPGLTTTDDAHRFVEGLFVDGNWTDASRSNRLVVDADALNILATVPDWPSHIPPWTILTPHPGEMARLSGESIAEINARRIHSARSWSVQWGHVVVLKGAHSVIAAPDGRIAVLPFAVPTLATAGSGDVLAGAIAAMLSQGLDPFKAAICGAYVHGHAGLLIARDVGMAGATAKDILEHLSTALRDLYRGG